MIGLLKYIILPSILTILSIQNECCFLKKVGEYEYFLLEESSEATDHGCVNGCIYHRSGDDSKNRWCFKAGMEQSECQLEDLGEVVSMETHPCNRECSPNNPKICHFSFVAEAGYTLDNPALRGADGRNRSVLTFNGQLPGPLLVVCEGDTVIVTLENKIEDGPITNSDGSPNTTTLHFHGIREVGTSDQQVFGPWSDGVPFVNQCPIGPGKKFSYTFKATAENRNAKPGSYWYHSHVGSQRTNGLQGGLVIKPIEKYMYEGKPVIDEPTNYTVVVQEWYISPTRQAPVSILVNGKSKIAEKVFDCSDLQLVNNYLRGIGAVFPKIPNPFITDPTGQYAAFHLEKGKTYRFRILGLIGQNLPTRISIDNKESASDSTYTNFKFVAISADSLDIEPIENLDYLWVSPGERYDILFTLPNEVSSDKALKMRFIGYTNLNDPANAGPAALCSVAFLKFTGSPYDTGYIVPDDCSDFPDHDQPFPPDKRVLNPPVKATATLQAEQYVFFDKIDDIYADPTMTGNIFPVDITSREKQIVVVNELLVTTEFIEFNPSTTFNGIRTEFPRIPYLLQDPERDGPRCTFATKDSGGFYQIKSEDGGTSTFCQHVLKFPKGEKVLLNEWQEIVLINSNTESASHPIHQHGGWFWVIGEGQFKHEIDRKFIKENIESLRQNTNDATRRTSYRKPLDHDHFLPKDVIQVPNRGYVILRTHLDNPGTFIFHCHIDFHLSLGMGLVEQIGSFSDWNIKNFNNEPSISKKNLVCEEEPPCPRGGNDRINLFYGMSTKDNPVSRCVTINSTVTFFWTATTDGHNVNYIGKEGQSAGGKTARQFYDECIVEPGTVLPSGDIIVNSPGTPNYYAHLFTETGVYFFYCGIRYKEGDNKYGSHCKDGGVKAWVNVVNDPSECHYHSHPKCGAPGATPPPLTTTTTN